MKIVYFGDSFSVNKDGYPGMVCDHYGAEYENRSKAGSSLDYCYMMLMDYFKDNPEPDVAIITVTSSERIYHDNYTIMLSGVSSYDRTPVPYGVRRAAHEYYINIHSNMTAYIRSEMFNSALSLFTLKYPLTKFIILPCFEPWRNDSLIGNYIASGPRLMNFSEMESDLMAKEVRGEKTDRNNHLTREQNITLSKSIIDMIDNKYVQNLPQVYTIDLSKTY